MCKQLTQKLSENAISGILSGNDLGKKIRNDFGLFLLENNNLDIEIQIPDNVTLISESFFYGLFGIPSELTFDEFSKTYKITGPKPVLFQIAEYLRLSQMHGKWSRKRKRK